MEGVNLTESQYKQSNPPFTNPCLIEKLVSIRQKILLWLCVGVGATDRFSPWWGHTLRFLSRMVHKVGPD